MTVAIKPSPKQAPGVGVARTLHRSQRWVKGAAIAFGDTSPINVFEIPGDVLVVGGLVEVTDAFDVLGTSPAATVVVSVPNATGTANLWDAGLAGLLTTGYKPFSVFTKTPSSGGYVIATYTAGTTTAGSMSVYLSYVEPDAEL